MQSTHRRGLKSTLLGCGGVVALAGSSVAWAQSAPTTSLQATGGGAVGLEEVIVTARRREESAQRVPISVLAVSGETLRAQTIQVTSDIPKLAPGLTVGPSPLGTSRPAYAIRGLRAQATRIFNDPAIVVYFAEVGSARASGTTNALYDIQSVQVLKGPQGTLFGRNTTGGAVLITPNAPTETFEGYVQGTAGDYDLRAGEAMVNIPVNDKVQLRAAARIMRRDGYFENVFRPGEKAFEEHYESYRVSLRLKPTESITSDFIAALYHSDYHGYQVKLDSVNTALVPLPALRPALLAELATTKALGFYQYRELFPTRDGDNTKFFVNNTQIELGDFTIKNIISYLKLFNRYSQNADGSALGVLRNDGTYRGDQFSNELQLQGKVDNLDFVLGAFYSVEEGTDFGATQTFNALPLVLNDYNGKNTSASVFAHGTLQLSGIAEGLAVTGGARLTRDKRYAESHVRAQNATNITCRSENNKVIANFTDRSLCVLARERSFTEPTYDVGLTYQIAPDHMVYGTFSHGYRSGAPANTIAIDGLRPEKVDVVEVGSKNVFDVGGVPVRFNIDGYYGWYKDLQRSPSVIIPGTNAVTSADVNAAKAHVYGVETELEARLTRSLRVSASYALTEAAYDAFVNKRVFQGQVVDVDVSDGIIPYTPKHALSLGLVYSPDMPEHIGQPSLSLGYIYQTSFQTTESNTNNCGPIGPTGFGIETGCLNTAGLLPGYGLANLRLDWERPFRSPVEVGFFVTNLFDKKYYNSTITLTSNLGVAARSPGPPRMFGVDIRVPFGG